MKIYIRAALVTDYMSTDQLHRYMNNVNFGDFDSYQQEDGMIVRTDKHAEVSPQSDIGITSKYFKFIKSVDGSWEAYEVSKDRHRIGRTFEL